MNNNYEQSWTLKLCLLIHIRSDLDAKTSHVIYIINYTLI